MTDKYRISVEDKLVYFITDDIVHAGWVGFRFAKDHADLVKDGWEIYYYNHDGSCPVKGLFACYSYVSLGRYVSDAVLEAKSPKHCESCTCTIEERTCCK